MKASDERREVCACPVLFTRVLLSTLTRQSDSGVVVDSVFLWPIGKKTDGGFDGGGKGDQKLGIPSVFTDNFEYGASFIFKVSGNRQIIIIPIWLVFRSQILFCCK